MLNIYYSYFQVTHRFTKKFIETIEEKKIWRQIVKFSNPLNPTLPIPQSSNQIEGSEENKKFSYLSKRPYKSIVRARVLSIPLNIESPQLFNGRIFRNYLMR